MGIKLLFHCLCSLFVLDGVIENIQAEMGIAVYGTAHAFWSIWCGLCRLGVHQAECEFPGSAVGVGVPSTGGAAPPAYNSQRAARRTAGRSPTPAPSCARIGRCPFEPANSGGPVPVAANNVA